MACAITGLTAAEKSLVAEAWKNISPKKKDYGVELFMSLFTAHPDALDHFKNFPSKNLDEIKNTADMRAHAAAVMYALDSLVDNLEDPECMVGLIRKIARNHKSRGIGKSRFEQLRGIFGNFLDTSLGGKSNATTKGAWDKFLHFTNNQIETMQA
ncbi:hypothetical protein LOTGIDRAFT_231953 [Lottia gigantea]|uniref:Globin n=1 Tax=Lottia gigantea TaxID=225164 RepID=V4C2N0_LOTGI|nr:hypothetical protein LOTGIDRAFT_231953 [Lottia gigantea]ESO95779.1 hypothetical protein LOTGIDRAFT_231953 [Lottia gigantea]